MKKKIVIIREEYLDITNNFCAAKLIEYFKHWTDWKIDVHRTPWVYQPLEKIRYDLLGEHSINSIRNAIDILMNLNLIERRNNPGNKQDRTYQYRLNLDVLNLYLEGNESKDIEFSSNSGNCKNESCGFNFEGTYHSINPKNPDPIQQHVAVESENWNDEQIRKYLEEQGLIDSQSAATNVKEEIQIKTPELQVEKPVLKTPQLSANFVSASEEEINKVIDELKRININPEACKRTIENFFDNVSGAIARVKEAIQQGWCKNPTGLFIASCKSGAKAMKASVSSDVNTWFNWARSQRIVLAMSEGWAYTPDDRAVKLEEIMQQYPIPVT